MPNGAWLSLKPEKGFSRHHRVPRRIGGQNTYRNISILGDREHALWHSVYGSRCAAYTISVEFKIQEQLELKEKVALSDKHTGHLVYIPCLEVDLTRRCLDHYTELRDGKTQEEYYVFINHKMNDPYYPWIVM